RRHPLHDRSRRHALAVSGRPPGGRALRVAKGRCYNSLARRRPPRRRSFMKAIRVHTPGGPEALKLDDIPSPTPKAGEAVVQVDAAGLNYIDVYFRTGMYKAELPLTIGMEAGGTVTAVGSNVSEVKVGDKVAYTGVAGAYAEQAVVPSSKLVVLPAGVSTRQGA